ncbi:MAG: Nif3-like dinuclear metal center hexameric protein [Lachnospiraceae bacterium]|nr:Nif3-like dinuclear metal center hexameric protein [Lachnospiraceae bacterium]
MKLERLIELFNDIADPGLCSDWDNSGLIAGDEEKEIRRVLCALDATDEVIDEAVELKADLILTHHPLIFRGIKKVNNRDFTGRRIMKLVRNDIACFAMHTNFDISCMSDEAADRLGLSDTKILQPTGDDIGFGRVGNLSARMRIDELSELVKECFCLEHVKVFGDLQKSVQKAAIMPGSGASAINDSVNAKAEVLVTGDIGHHEGIDAVEKGIAIIDAGHFGIEKIFIEYMKDYIKRNADDIEVFTDNREKGFSII